MRRCVVLFALLSTALCAQDSRDVLNRGIAAFKGGNYSQAVDLFQQAVALDTNAVNPHLYLATAYMSEWRPADGLDVIAQRANVEFRRVLELDPVNQTALASLASLACNIATALSGEAKTAKLDEAMDWYKRLATVSPTNKEAPYSMGVIAWAKWYPPYMTARASVQMKPQDPGPLPPAQREGLKVQYSALLDEGVANLKQALLIDPNYSDAMAYLNLLIRERADLRDTKGEYAADIAVADDWVQKALAAKRSQTASGMAAPPPPPPPPPSGGGGGGSASLIRGDVTPVSTVDPVYPPLARQARISGTVRFTVRIAKDGSVQSIQLVSGHPLLVAAAHEAVKQYVYRPVLLNGSPVEAVTQVDVNFSLNN